MRLRYIFLPDYGPLKDVAVAFGQNQHIEGRKGVVNFVVGLNGSGKSSLLRAIYDVFHSLSHEELPKFPVTLAYDIREGSHLRTILFHRPRGPASDCFLVNAASCPPGKTSDEWQSWIDSDVVPGKHQWPRCISGDQLKGNGDLRNWLPTRVLAYTSGDIAPWQSMAYPSFPADELTSGQTTFDRTQERPHGWSSEREHYDIRMPSGGESSNDVPQGASELAAEIEERCLLLTPEDVRLAAISVGIWQAALELEDRNEKDQQEAFRNELLAQLKAKTPGEGARRLLNELDWLWATHASFLFANPSLQRRHPDAALAFWLHALADVVLQYPLEESLSVITLGNRPIVRPEDLVRGEPVRGALEAAGEPMRNASCGAEALRSLFSSGQPADESLWNIFQTLRSWQAYGLLTEVQLTVKRIHQVPDAEGKFDDSLISYANFSDGEQMLLGRMALLLLLHKQDNSLLLLDEPETHFNDAWKRQIIDMVDDNVLKDAFTQVLVATHTSLALTDVFSCEITRLTKDEGITGVQPIVHPTFGADPGRILLHVFGAPDVIGARAAEFLRSKLDPAKWPPEDREKLQLLIDEIGSGWPRAKLMEILKLIESPDVTPGPSFD